jgi:E3 SUMO-protein ligase PIAS1
MRMQLPCRGILCHHNQCFDAMSYLQTQEQAPQWTCPTCNRTCRYEDLAIDQYVQDIIANTSSSTDQVTIEPNGEWRQLKADDRNGKSQEKQNNNMKKQSQVFTLDDDDVVAYRPSVNRAGSVSTSYNTPEASSRAPSTSISTGPRQNKKRPADDVVDLTLDSDDADEEPRRPVKRQSTLPSMTNSSTSLFRPGMSASPSVGPTSIPGLGAKPAPQVQPRYGFNLPPHNQSPPYPQQPPNNYHPVPGFGTYGHQSGYASYPPS